MLADHDLAFQQSLQSLKPRACLAVVRGGSVQLVLRANVGSWVHRQSIVLFAAPGPSGTHVSGVGEKPPAQEGWFQTGPGPKIKNFIVVNFRISDHFRFGPKVSKPDIVGGRGVGGGGRGGGGGGGRGRSTTAKPWICFEFG